MRIIYGVDSTLEENLRKDACGVLCSAGMNPSTVFSKLTDTAPDVLEEL